MRAVCIIPARGGSRRIPKKNIKDFHGKPIIAYSIEGAKQADIFEHVIVSTDDQGIADIAEKCGADVYISPDALGDNEVGTQEVIRDVLENLAPTSFACCLYPTVPMLDPNELKQAYKHLRFSPEIDYIVPVANWLSDPGRWYFGRASCFMKDTPLIGSGTRLMKINPLLAIDINTPEDWEKAEAMYADLHGIK